MQQETVTLVCYLPTVTRIRESVVSDTMQQETVMRDCCFPTVTWIRICICCWSLSYSVILRPRADSLRSHVILHKLFIARFWISSEVVYLQRWHGWCRLQLLPSRSVMCIPYNHAPCHFMQLSHMRTVHAHLAVICHFWQTDRGLSRTTVVIDTLWRKRQSCVNGTTVTRDSESVVTDTMQQETAMCDCCPTPVTRIKESVVTETFCDCCFTKDMRMSYYHRVISEKWIWLK